MRVPSRPHATGGLALKEIRNDLPLASHFIAATGPPRWSPACPYGLRETGLSLGPFTLSRVLLREAAGGGAPTANGFGYSGIYSALPEALVEADAFLLTPLEAVAFVTGNSRQS